ncbi:DUF368 domain-containing protein [Halocatena marina]|uniref:DUF368 domain-containing protein n=1 Tax=Halocatena marina TaxID=2934937 RepID=A0ABD5YMU5_9EURY|nr:DUF368 domain-containing protein [Halocatena marina]
MGGTGPREWFVIYLKGVCMGAADTVPGVSGGTIALIAGIYERLIDAIAGIDPRVLEHVPYLHTSDGRASLYDDLVEMDVPFLIALGMGIVTAVVVMSGIMHEAIKGHPVPTSSFFFGLIAAAAVVLYRYVSIDSVPRAAAALVGFALAFLLTGFTSGSSGTHSPLLLFGSGAIAICAMVLPGISGAFILYMFGQYEYMSALPGQFISQLLAVVTGGDSSALVATAIPIVAFVIGAFLGLFTITHIIRYALSNYRQATLTFLVSLMLGSLRAPVITINSEVSELTPGVIGIIVAAGVIGVTLVFFLDRFTEDIEFGADQQPSRTESPMND